MRKVAVAIEKIGTSDQYELVGGPSEDVSAIIELAKAESIKRGRGENTLIVFSTSSGAEKVYKIAAKAIESKKRNNK